MVYDMNSVSTHNKPGCMDVPTTLGHEFSASTPSSGAHFQTEEGFDAENSWPRVVDTPFGLLYVDY